MANDSCLVPAHPPMANDSCLVPAHPPIANDSCLVPAHPPMASDSCLEPAHLGYTEKKLQSGCCYCYSDRTSYFGSNINKLRYYLRLFLQSICSCMNNTVRTTRLVSEFSDINTYY